MKNYFRHVAIALLLTPFVTLPVQADLQSGTSEQLKNELSTTTTPSTKDAKSTTPDASVLERFRTHNGSRTPLTLTALFAAPETAAIRQLPEVALSDGITTMKISIARGSQNNIAPNVAFEGAKLISLKQNNGDEWDIEALPAAGTWKVSLLLQTDSITREIPLTVAPALPAGTDFSEKGFIAFLGGPTPPSQPLLDLNNDGRRDYLDDYIFTANYLVNLRLAADIPNAAQPTESQIPTIAQPSEALMPNTGAESAPLPTNSSHPPADKGLSTGQTPYQRSLVDRNQRARELTERLQGMPATRAPAAVPPAR